MENNPK